MGALRAAVPPAIVVPPHSQKQVDYVTLVADYSSDQTSSTNSSPRQPVFGDRLEVPPSPYTRPKVSVTRASTLVSKRDSLKPKIPVLGPLVTDKALLAPPTADDAFSNSTVFDFFNDDERRSLVTQMPVCDDEPQSPTSPSSRRLSNISMFSSFSPLEKARRRVFSSASDHIINIYAAHALPLSNFCEVIRLHRSLQRAEIVRTETYTQTRLGAIRHRFIILELKRSGRKNVYLRLDRRLGKGNSTYSLIRNGTTDSNDVAQLATEKKDLIGSGRFENRQEFQTIPTLGELRHFLVVITEEIREYQVWPANCWFFCSLIQEHLGGEYHGSFVDGNIQHPELARDIRNRVKERLRCLYHVPRTSSITNLLEASLRQDNPSLRDAHKSALKNSRLWDQEHVDRRLSSRARTLGHELLKDLLPILAHLHISERYIEERFLWVEHIRLCQILVAAEPSSPIYRAKLAHSLFNYSVCLHEYRTDTEAQGSRSQESCKVQAEAITIRRALYKQDKRHCWDLAASLYNYGVTLGSLRRFREAREAEEAAVALRRILYQADPTPKHRAALAQSMYNYGLTLGELGPRSLDESCRILGECVKLRRAAEQAYGRPAPPKAPAPSTSSTDHEHRYVRFGEIWGLDLVTALHAYGWALHRTGRYEEAYGVKKEAVIAFQQSAHRRADLAAAEHNLGVSLYALGAIRHARIAFGKATDLRKEVLVAVVSPYERKDSVLSRQAEASEAYVSSLEQFLMCDNELQQYGS
ncbi:hypothetical protein DL93DRAFT_2227031 [Clavulina sp. PMI_390]|nr:hypothetical protein DL93DRAFT_2227031 [Clavulina sp. PMI_390]